MKVYSLGKNNVASKFENISIIHLKLSTEEIQNILEQQNSNQEYKPLNTKNRSNEKFLSSYEETYSYSSYHTETTDININKDVESKLNKILMNYNLSPNNYLYEQINNISAMNEFTSLNTWIRSTNILCWWCKHNFTATPVAIPNYLIDNTFHCQGCFCSFNCSLAYIYKENEDINTKIVLLKKMHQQINGTELDIQKVAIDWKYLKVFGGIFTIEQFRENAILMNNCSYIPYPLKYIETEINLNITKNV